MGKTIFRGIVRGNSIELDEAPAVPNGEPVMVEIHTQGPASDGIRASSGAWSDAGQELDQWLADVYRARHADRRMDAP